MTDVLAHLGPPVGPLAPRRMVTIGPKLLDGLRAIDYWQSTHEYMADEWLRRHGYPDKVADDILERLERKDLIESGVSSRTGWLTDTGREVLRLSQTRTPHTYGQCRYCPEYHATYPGNR